ncbi:Transcription factor BIM2 [Apostasia shenzhenica]|uniref:Transcription factor BIM2 n=1 Tax=Apostasia shenzhenica TaxID=1088818 RepID=A0A2H9ZSR5_9ASPA|nr:Transcription factor BIM2 [Apostasia shenzhenica]
MESASRFSKGFEDDDEDEEELGKREGSSLKELTVMVDGKSSDHMACTPRSKHSATEQRRRSKINDRFQILRGLLPNSDQKKDKASFLLEVIEYIQFLQEKVQKYESLYPGWNDENTKLMPWVKVYFRSFWKNSRNNHHCSSDGMVDPQSAKNAAAPCYVISENNIPVPPSVLSSAQNPAETDLRAGVCYKEIEHHSGFAGKVAAAPPSFQPNIYPMIGRGNGVGQPLHRLISEVDNLASPSHWSRPTSLADCSVSSDMLNEQEELTIDEGTINVSSAYSQGLLNTLSQALQNSGIDLAQASISVHINLGRRSGSKHNVSTSLTTAKNKDEHPLLSSNLSIGPARTGSRSDEFGQAAKRHKSVHV